MDRPDTIVRFLACRRLALIGVSRDPKDFSRAVLRAFLDRGYDAIPVNPAADEIDGRRCYPSIEEVRPAVEAALLMTPPDRSAAAVDACLAAGVRRIWLHRGVGRGSVSANAVALCRASGVDVVPGACPFMYLPGTAVPHRVHGFFHRLRHGRAA
jgi:predicted CoA-binding protein